MNELQQAIYDYLAKENAWRAAWEIEPIIDSGPGSGDVALNELVAMGALIAETNQGMILYTIDPRWRPPEPDGE